MNRETRTGPAVNTAIDEKLLREDDVETDADAAAPLDADWPEREARGTPPPDDGDNDASSYGQSVDADQVRDEGVAESLGKAVSAPVRDADTDVDSGQGRR